MMDRLQRYASMLECMRDQSLPCHGGERIRDASVWGGWMRVIPLVGNLRIHSLGEKTPEFSDNATSDKCSCGCYKSIV
jgi:hypothetical protein